MLIVRGQLSKPHFCDLVEFYYVLDHNEEGYIPFLNLFRLLDCPSFLDYLTEFINHYQMHLRSDQMDDIDDWVEDMVERYEYEIKNYTRRNQLNFVIRTVELIDFTCVFMELLYDQGIVEIYKAVVEEIKVGKYGQVTVTFEEDYLCD